ncbi:MAG: ASCH domain-containing protein [Tannerellaceae bacterium]
MKVLDLIIKQKYFDAIMAGKKVQEFREVRPTTIKKYLQLDEEGFEIEDEKGNAKPIEYDAIRFFVGYNKGRDSALVEVTSSFCEIFVDENDEPIEYEYEGEIWVSEQMVYNLGKILEHNIRDKLNKD